jgi:ureidoglycolate lyase
MTPRTIQASTLTAEAFARFGDVIGATERGGSEANQGTARRFDWAAQLDNTRAHARPNLAVFRAFPQPTPFAVRYLERHPYSSQTFLPMGCFAYLVVVANADADKGPDLSSLSAFVCASGQGVNYHRGVWHHPIIALDSVAQFAMLVWEDETADDCVEEQLSAPILVEIGVRIP